MVFTEYKRGYKCLAIQKEIRRAESAEKQKIPVATMLPKRMQMATRISVNHAKTIVATLYSDEKRSDNGELRKLQRVTTVIANFVRTH